MVYDHGLVFGVGLVVVAADFGEDLVDGGVDLVRACVARLGFVVGLVLELDGVG